MSSPQTAAITAVQGWLPEDVLSNADLEKMVDTNDEWIRTRTGISERRILKDPEKATSDMASEVIKGLCAQRGISPEEVDLVIVATVTPDMFFPPRLSSPATRPAAPTPGDSTRAPPAVASSTPSGRAVNSWPAAPTRRSSWSAQTR